MLFALPAEATVLHFCARWLATGAVGVTTGFLTPAHDELGPRNRQDIHRAMTAVRPWREFQISVDGGATEGVTQRFFDKSTFHRAAAERVNGAAREEENDPRLRELLDLEVPYLSATLRTITVWREHRTLRFGWVAPTQEAIFPQMPTVEAYERGDWIELSGNFVRRGKTGEVHGRLSVEVRYDAPSDRLQVRNARCRVEVRTVIANLEDHTTLAPAVGVHAVKKLPPQRWLDQKP